MGKVLFVSHTTNFIKFNLPFMGWLEKEGMEVHYASAEEEPFPEGACARHFQLPFRRSPYSLDNLKACRGLRALMEREHYDLVHCHTPVGGVMARLAARRSRKLGAKVIYTAHGFHFFKGAPLQNWLLYYPVEKALSRCTDLLVTINGEDEARARAHFHCPVVKLDGVGVDLTRFRPPRVGEREALRRQHGLSPEDFVMIYAGELNANKNQTLLIEAMAKLDLPHVRLLLAGQGDREDFYRARIEALGLTGKVELLGYRKDMPELFRMADLAVASSIREGLGVNVIEAMASGLAAVVTDNRGHREVVKPGENGLLCPLGDGDAFADAVLRLAKDGALRQAMGRRALAMSRRYDLAIAVERMGQLYREVCPELWR
jgi:glycosyltransferase EpsD